MRALVTGATGFIGKRLVARLERPVVLSRDPARARRSLGEGVEIHAWEPEAGVAPVEAFRGVDAVFHLAGEPVAEGRWTASKKDRIRRSRVTGTSNLVAVLEKLSHRPRVLVSASAVGYYGDRGDEVLDENSAAGSDFLAGVCRQWEEAALAAPMGVRVVTLRTGIVLDKSGGALAKMLTPFKLGVGGRLGSGKQWMPWIHLDDLVEMYLHAAGQPNVSGAMNGVGPSPVTNGEFTRALASAVRRPAIFPAPAFGLRLAFGEMAQILLASQRVLPRAAERAGFRFKYPDLSAALRAAL